MGAGGRNAEVISSVILPGLIFHPPLSLAHPGTEDLYKTRDKIFQAQPEHELTGRHCEQEIKPRGSR